MGGARVIPPRVPSTYYTPAPVLRLIELAPPPSSSSACLIRLGGDGDSLHLGSGQADEGAGRDAFALICRLDDPGGGAGHSSSRVKRKILGSSPCDRAGAQGCPRPVEGGVTP